MHNYLLASQPPRYIGEVLVVQLTSTRTWIAGGKVAADSYGNVMYKLLFTDLQCAMLL